MTITEEILEATNGGLDIIADYYPKAREVAGTKDKFSLRNEKVPSAKINLRKTANDVDCYKVIDFGGTNHEMNAIDVIAYEEGISYKEAIRFALAKYPHTISRETREQDVTFEDPTSSDKVGDMSWTEQKVSERMLRELGRYVTEEGFDFYNWKCVDELRSVIKTKKGEIKVMVKKANDSKPIFVRKCFYRKDEKLEFFWKFYEPRALKQYRFKYYPEGSKPENYVHGLYEVEKLIESRNGERLPCLFIGAGEKDSLNINSLNGYNAETDRFDYHCPVIWFNSETAVVPPDIMRRIKKLAVKIVNIPDIDETGITQGNRFALENWDIYTLWLPRYIQEIKDWRGNPCKDFKDYLELGGDQKEMANLVTNSHKFKFWTIIESKDKDGNVSIKCVLDPENVTFALNVLGYRYDCVRGEDKFYYQNNHIIEEMQSQEIRRQLVGYLRSTLRVRDGIVYNTLMNTNKFTEWCRFLDKPREIVDMNGPYYQRYYFEDGWAEIEPEEVKKHNYRQLDCEISKERVREHRLGTYKPIFRYEWDEENRDYNVFFEKPTCKMFQYLVATSKIYWKEELAKLKEMDPAMTQGGMPLQITSELLTDDQNVEQCMSLRNKMFLMGYLCTKYKDAAKPWGVYLMDNKISDGTESNGGSGKSLFIEFAKLFLNEYFINGKNKKLSEDSHKYDGVTENTDIIRIDDLDKKFDVELLHNDVTGDLQVNPKGKQPFSIKRAKSPKIVIATNYVPLKTDASIKRRWRFGTFSDWFHVKTTNSEYDSDYNPKMMFHQTLIDDFDEKDMNETLCCIIDCVRYYMLCCKKGLVQDCILNNIEIRKLIVTVGADFMEWFKVYFDKENGMLNMEVAKNEAYMDYRQKVEHPFGQYIWSKKLKEYCKLIGYEYNPPEYCSGDGERIIKRWNGKPADYIFIRG